MADVQTNIKELVKAIDDNNTVSGSATVLVQTLMGQFEKVKGEPQEIQKLVDEVRKMATALTASIAANTVAQSANYDVHGRRVHSADGRAYGMPAAIMPDGSIQEAQRTDGEYDADGRPVNPRSPGFPRI